MRPSLVLHALLVAGRAFSAPSGKPPLTASSSDISLHDFYSNPPSCGVVRLASTVVQSLVCNGQCTAATEDIIEINLTDECMCDFFSSSQCDPRSHQAGGYGIKKELPGGVRYYKCDQSTFAVVHDDDSALRLRARNDAEPADVLVDNEIMGCGVAWYGDMTAQDSQWLLPSGQCENSLMGIKKYFVKAGCTCFFFGVIGDKSCNDQKAWAIGPYTADITDSNSYMCQQYSQTSLGSTGSAIEESIRRASGVSARDPASGAVERTPPSLPRCGLA